MVTIEIDDDLFNYLKMLAEPFTDTPNSVLRRLIMLDLHKPITKLSTTASTNKIPEKSAPSIDIFMSLFLKNRYGAKFRPLSPYRTMFESDNYLIYFQNFNKGETVNLWYRLSESSLDTLRKSEKTAIVCFTNPAEDIVYEIPVRDIDIQATKAKWGKAYMEVNIDPASSRWRELDWNIEQYLIRKTAELHGP